ncbi:MAG: carbohydrate kinase family protein [Victivallaceae bacterium]|nr:carbohydrate kinase family protein [Victivallaceae bacterium]
MKRQGIVAGGNWIIDKVKTIDRWPQEGELCNIAAETRAAGGGPCNVLFDLAALDTGLALYASGKVGFDDDGKWLLSEITRRGIDDCFMSTSKDLPTSYTDVMSGHSRRTFFHCRGANSQYGYEDAIAADTGARIFYLAYLLLLDTMDQSDPQFGTVAAKTLATLRERGYETLVDMVSEAGEKFLRIVPPALRYTDYLVVNEIEAGHCLGEAIRLEDDSIAYDKLPKAAEKLFEMGVGKLVVIHFPEGGYARTAAGKESFSPSCEVPSSEIVGTTGAGDAFCAGVLYAIHEGFALDRMLRFASASARFNLRSATASDGAPTLKELDDYLQTAKFRPIPPFFAQGTDR